MASDDDDLIARLMERVTPTRPVAARRRATGTAEPVPATPAAPEGESPVAPPRRRKGGSETAMQPLPGLAAKIRVPTSFGALPVEALRRRDELRNARGTFARVAHVDRMTFDTDFLIRHESLRPVMIRAGALGRGIPAIDISVSPAQKISPLKMPQPGSFKPARDYLNQPGVMRAPVELVTYYRFHTGETSAFQCEGIWMLAEA